MTFNIRLPTNILPLSLSSIFLNYYRGVKNTSIYGTLVFFSLEQLPDTEVHSQEQKLNARLAKTNTNETILTAGIAKAFACYTYTPPAAEIQS
jgi:hypothetical protein